MSKRAPKSGAARPAVNLDAIANAFEQAGSLLCDAECALRLDWDRRDLERCAALMAGAKAILDQSRARFLPAEGGNDA